MGPVQVKRLIKVKRPRKVEEPTEVNVKQRGGQFFFAHSVCELIPCSPTFKMTAPVAPPLNVVPQYFSRFS